jgi:hypothetical protein
MKYSFSHENSYVSQLLLTVFKVDFPEIYQKIIELTIVLDEVDEKLWKSQRISSLLELQDDIMINLSNYFKEILSSNPKKVFPPSSAAGTTGNVSQKIIQGQRSSNPLSSSKAKSDSFIISNSVGYYSNGKKQDSGKTDCSSLLDDHFNEIEEEELIPVMKSGNQSDFKNPFDWFDTICANSEKTSLFSSPFSSPHEEIDRQDQSDTEHDCHDDNDENNEDMDLEYFYPGEEKNHEKSVSKSSDYQKSMNLKSESSANLKKSRSLSVDPFSESLPVDIFEKSLYVEKSHFDRLSSFEEFEEDTSINQQQQDNEKKKEKENDKSNLLKLEESSFYNPFFFEKKATKYFSCPICLNSKSRIDGSIEMDNCGHRYCFLCLKQYITKKIDSKEITENQLICPYEHCSISLSTIMIQGIVDNESWEKYQEYSTSATIEHEIHYGLGLRCPNPCCHNIFMFNSIEEKRVALNDNYSGFHFFCDSRMSGCNSSFCINCKGIYNQTGPSHPPYTCYEYQAVLQTNKEEKFRYERWKENYQKQNPKDPLFDKLVEKDGLKPCPVCTIMIQKTEGCDHMKCTICNCNFCYVCGKYNHLTPTKRGDCGPKHGDRNWSHPDSY